MLGSLNGAISLGSRGKHRAAQGPSSGAGHQRRGGRATRPGEVYANQLREAGVRVTAVSFLGAIHDFVMLDALADSAATRAAIALATAWLREEFSTCRQAR
jgi:hypothetical protein